MAQMSRLQTGLLEHLPAAPAACLIFLMARTSPKVPGFPVY